jgi:hypothetical protein
LRILLLASVLGVAAAQTTPPFSHRVHIALQLACAICHPEAASSTRLEDNPLPSGDVCLRCHKTAQIALPRAARVARFNHQLHLKLGNIAPIIASAIDHKQYLAPAGTGMRAALNTADACIACHRGLISSDQAAGGLRQMADCLVCHTHIDPPDSCEFCHSKGIALKPTNHTPDFLDTHTTGKLGLDEQTCAVCHGRHFRCLGCH